MAGISNHFDTMTAIKAKIDGLAFSGLTGGVKVQEVAMYQDQQNILPFISVSPYGPEKMGNETAFRDGRYYGTLVAIIAKPSLASLEVRLGWRQSLQRALHNTKFGDTVSGDYNWNVEPGNAIEPEAWFSRGNLYVSGMVVRAWFQESRL